MEWTLIASGALAAISALFAFLCLMFSVLEWKDHGLKKHNWKDIFGAMASGILLSLLAIGFVWGGIENFGDEVRCDALGGQMLNNDCVKVEKIGE